MSRRSDPELLDMAFALFLSTPWWLGPPVVALVFAAFWFTPLVFPEQNGLHFREHILHGLAWIAAGVVALAWLVAGVVKLVRARNR